MIIDPIRHCLVDHRASLRPLTHKNVLLNLISDQKEVKKRCRPYLTLFRYHVIVVKVELKL